MIYTSYFANAKNIKKKQFVSISRVTPSWFDFDIIEAKELAPSSKLLVAYKNEEVDTIEYEKIYKKETLSKLDPKEIYEKYNNSVFLCYEKRGDFCHRNIVSAWLEENGYSSKEIEPVKLAIVGSRAHNPVPIRQITEDNIEEFNLFSYIIDKFIEKNPEIEIVSGGANGTDYFAEEYAKRNNIKIKIFEADWSKGKHAGFLRNNEIWDYADIGIAFWNGKSKGTKHSFKLSYERNKKCFIFDFKKKCFIPRIVKGDILRSNAEVIAFTANSVIKNNRSLVMGAGCAKVFKDNFEGIDKMFENISTNFGWKVVDFKGKKIGAFQTKIHYRNNSTLEIIKHSIEELKKDIKNYDSIAICFPGILNGGLKREDVLPLFDGMTLDLFIRG